MNLTPRMIIAVVFACLIWASAFVFVKIGLRHAPPLLLAGLRFVLAGAMLAPFCGHPRRFLAAVGANWRHVLVVSFFATALHYALFFWGMTLVRGAQGAIIVGSAPLLTALLAHGLTRNERLTPRKLGIIGLGMIGMALLALAAQPWHPAGLRELAGMAILLVCEASFVLSTIIVLGKIHTELPPVALNSAQMGLGGAAILLLSLLIEGTPHVSPHPELWGSVAAMAMISAVAFSIWFHLLQTVKVSALNVWLFLIPVFGATMSWLFLPNESPDALSITGMLIIVVSIILFHRQAEQPRAVETPVEV